jgi:hypothetical protein
MPRRQDLFKKIVETRSIARDKFQVDSTPTFFINRKRLKGEHQLKDFEAALASLSVKRIGPRPKARRLAPRDKHT